MGERCNVQSTAVLPRVVILDDLGDGAPESTAVLLDDEPAVGLDPTESDAAWEARVLRAFTRKVDALKD